MTDLALMEDAGDWLEQADDEVIGLHLLASDLRHFQATYTKGAKAWWDSYHVQLASTILLVELTADRLERENR